MAFNYQIFPCKQIFSITFKIRHSIACSRFIRAFGTTLLPIGSDLHASMFDDGGVVAPGGFGQVDGLVPGEPSAQELGANPQGPSARDTLNSALVKRISNPSDFARFHFGPGSLSTKNIFFKIKGHDLSTPSYAILLIKGAQLINVPFNLQIFII